MAVAEARPLAAPVRCSVVIATLNRTDSLRVVLRCLGRQSRPPIEVVIAVSAGGDPVASLGESSLPFRLMTVHCPEKSAALQRNLGAAAAIGDVLAFLDDDIEFGDDVFARVLEHFDRLPEAGLGALSPRISNMDRKVPGRLTRWYYSVQAGYRHADFGGRLFGPGINCFPLFGSGGPQLVQVEWLPSTCLFVRTRLFNRHCFPPFTGYSFAEDVHLTARIVREAPLFFLREPSITHHSLPNEFKSDRAALTSGKLHNMAIVAREVMGLSGWKLWWRWQFHRLFLSAVLVIRRPLQWADELRGIWQARQ